MRQRLGFPRVLSELDAITHNCLIQTESYSETVPAALITSFLLRGLGEIFAMNGWVSWQSPVINSIHRRRKRHFWLC